MGVVAVLVLELALDEDTGIVYFFFPLLYFLGGFFQIMTGQGEKGVV